MKRILIAGFIAMSCTFAIQAAEPIEHTVERGETLGSIAKRYNVTEKAITDANPDASEYFYAGMVLIIPQSDSNKKNGHIGQDNSSLNNEDTLLKSTDNNSSENASDYSFSKDRATSRFNTLSPKEFSSLSLTYMASFKDFDHGFYGIAFDSYHDSGFGFHLEYKANYGIVKSGNMGFYFGPQYGYRVTEYFMPSIKLKGYIQTQDVVTGYKSGYLHSGPVSENITSFTVGGGIHFTPTLNFKFGRVVLGIGYDLGFFSIKGSNPDVNDFNPDFDFDFDDYYYTPAKNLGTRSSYHIDTVKYKRKQQTSFSHGLEIQLGITI